ncbi:GGDEF domain [Shewanella denitrificans OS217]|uniref:GGDEF domain n=1 Tax=Shewanella denitrificans (strain OS217 / ATCC BAA-1090 / DSM 15013) TaxID=318161 RepID=Q12N63_SHEDO|nr:GGDEF domain-containing protein [Shewanella denitrificans]ABE55113.1 GGDEF domain [Shewanella denitrificans OS217]
MAEHKQDHKVIEKLRADVLRLESLEQQIDSLQQERNNLIDSSTKLSSRLDEYRQGMEEWEWFFRNSLEGLCIAGLDGYFKRVNPAFAAMLGYSVEELLAKPFSSFIHPDDLSKTATELHSLGSGVDSINFENRYRNKQGEWRWLSWHCPGVKQTSKLYAIARDVTDTKQAQADILYKATHDTLTKLYNRAAFDDNLADAMARAKRNTSNLVIMYLIDLDGFKTVNDTHGHPVGDRVLKVLAKRLLNAQRQGEMVCRLGGDEFAILIEGTGDTQVSPLAERILLSIKQPIDVEELQLSIGCSIGISIYPSLAANSDELFSQSDKAMYTIKNTGKNGFCLYKNQPN